MKTSLRSIIAQAALVVAGAVTVTAASADVVIVAPTAPPAPRFERVPPPRAGYVWDAGHWNWEGGRYVWAGGRWEAERIGHRWMPGEWIREGGQYRWVPAHWA